MFLRKKWGFIQLLQVKTAINGNTTGFISENKYSNGKKKKIEGHELIKLFSQDYSLEFIIDTCWNFNLVIFYIS